MAFIARHAESTNTLAFRLAEGGEDVGRAAVTDDARAGLVSAVVERGDANGDRVRHALALFRAREASEHDKRSAIVTLDWGIWPPPNSATGSSSGRTLLRAFGEVTVCRSDSARADAL